MFAQGPPSPTTGFDFNQPVILIHCRSCGGYYPLRGSDLVDFHPTCRCTSTWTGFSTTTFVVANLHTNLDYVFDSLSRKIRKFGKELDVKLAQRRQWTRDAVEARRALALRTRVRTPAPTPFEPPRGRAVSKAQAWRMRV